MDQPIEMLTRADDVVRYKAKFSLIALWIFAGIIIGIMILFNSITIRANTIRREVLLHISYPHSDKFGGMNAFNVEKNNKKFFLTRLKSNHAKYDKSPEGQAIQVHLIRKAKTGTSRINDGFQIKPLPK